MGSEWRRCRLGDVADINPDSIGPDWPYGHIRYVDISSVGEGVIKESPRRLSLSEAPSRARRLVKVGDTVLSTVRPNRRSMFFVREAVPDMVVSTGFAVLRPRPGIIEPRFLYAIVFDRRFTAYLVSRQRGAAYPAVLPSDIAEAEILLPPLPEQRAIAHILGALDDKIELNRRMNETLEAMAQALFKSWFVDFDPVVVNALRAGNPIPEKFAARAAHYRDNPDALGLPEDILRLFPARFVDSELDPIPEGWEVGPLSKIANLHTATATPSQEPEAIWEHYSIPAFDEGRMPKLEHGKDIKSGKYRVPATAVLVSKLNPQFPRVWLPDVIDETRAVCSTEFLPFVPRKSQWRPIVYEILRSDAVQEKIRSIATGSTGSRQRVKPKAVAELNIVLASERLLDTFSEWVAPIHNRLLLNQNESRTLAELRDTLLPKLISGELRVPDVEKILEEAV